MQKYLTLIFFVTLTKVSASDLVPLDYGNPHELPSTSTWNVFAANNALKMGLPSVAAIYFREFLQSKDIPEEARKEYTLSLVTSLIALQDFKAAELYLDTLPANIQDPAYALRAAILSFQKGNRVRAKRFIQKMTPDDFSSSDRPWYYILKGLLAEGKNTTEEANKFFKKALENAISLEQKAEFETLIAREQIFSGKVDSSLLRNLKFKTHKHKGTETGAQFAKQYAILLEKSGKKEEAIKVLNQQIEIFPKDPQELNSLLFVKALLLGAENSEKERLLQRILQNNYNPELMQQSLLVLFQINEQKNKLKPFLSFIEQLIQSESHHKIMEKLLFIQAQAFLLQKDYASSENVIHLALKEFPGTSEKSAFLKLLAFIAWHRNPPEYRNTANFLLQVRSGKKVSRSEFAHLTLLIADCYFLNKDYPNARDFYLSALNEVKKPFNVSQVAYQWVLSSIENNDFKFASNDLHRAIQEKWLSPAEQWRLEWNLSIALKENGEKEKAFERIQQALAKEEEIPTDLFLRFLWLDAELSLEEGFSKKAQQIADRLIEILQKKNILLSEKEKKELLGYSLLLQGKAFFQEDKDEKALEVLKKLRSQVPHTEAAIRSYLEAARYYASINDRVKAQQNLIDLVDAYPNSPYAPSALYEAALNIELRGQSHFKKAFSVLDRLLKEYPESQWDFLARMKQADLLRQLNDFPSAQQIYENLLQKYPKRDTHTVELARARCLMASQEKDENRKDLASIEFERLFDLSTSPVDLRTEAGFLWAYTGEQEGEADMAKKRYWSVLHRFLISPSQSYTFEAEGRYWLSRCAFQLANILSNQEKTTEAKEVYALILKFELPGQALAQSKIQQ